MSHDYYSQLWLKIQLSADTPVTYSCSTQLCDDDSLVSCDTAISLYHLHGRFVARNAANRSSVVPS